MPDFLYVSLQGDDKILRFAMDSATGALTAIGTVAVPGGPAPMVVDPTQRFLHVARRGESKVSSYRIDQRTADLELIGTVSLPTDPCYIATDRGEGTERNPAIPVRRNDRPSDAELPGEGEPSGTDRPTPLLLSSREGHSVFLQ